VNTKKRDDCWRQTHTNVKFNNPFYVNSVIRNTKPKRYGFKYKRILFSAVGFTWLSWVSNLIEFDNGTFLSTDQQVSFVIYDVFSTVQIIRIWQQTEGRFWAVCEGKCSWRIPIVQPTRCTCYLKLLILAKRSTFFGRSFRSSSGAQNSTYSNGICQRAAATCC
jgi:hypothetical protein